MRALCPGFPTRAPGASKVSLRDTVIESIHQNSLKSGSACFLLSTHNPLIHPSMYSIYASIHLPLHPSTHPPILPSIIHLSIIYHPSINHPSIHHPSSSQPAIVHPSIPLSIHLVIGPQRCRASDFCSLSQVLLQLPAAASQLQLPPLKPRPLLKTTWGALSVPRKTAPGPGPSASSLPLPPRMPRPGGLPCGTKR